MNLYVRFERPSDCAEWDEIPASATESEAPEQLTIGPFEWVQLTYNELRIAPEGDWVARFVKDAWHLCPDERAQALGVPAHPYPFSDLVIFPGNPA